MAIPTTPQWQRALRVLREECILSSDPVLSRVAYAMECAVRWATEDTVQWGTLADQAREEAAILRAELRESRAREGA